MEYFILHLLTFIVLSSCAGPSTPFGSSISMSSQYTKRPLTEPSRYNASTNISANESISHMHKGHSSFITANSLPSMQLYHTPYNLEVNIYDKMGVPRNFQYQVFYNGKILDNWWKTEDIIFSQTDPTHVKILFRGLYLTDEKDHDIKIHYYRDKNAAAYTLNIAPPRCRYNESLPLNNLGPFEAKGVLTKSEIESLATDNSINPSLIAGLIAQESSFNTKALSWAKALGLTQVTPIANQEIIQFKKDWPVDQAIRKKTYLELRKDIFLGKITSKTDWRLDKKRSIEGGIIYTKILNDHWRRKSNLKLLRRLYPQEIPWTDIILASYNSGAYRVKKNMRLKNKEWIESRELKEAKKYIKKIKSYCYAFSEIKKSSIR